MIQTIKKYLFHSWPGQGENPLEYRESITDGGYKDLFLLAALAAALEVLAHVG